MANLVPAEGGLDLEFVTHINVDPVDAIIAGDIPTRQQVYAETQRLLRIQRAEKRGGVLAVNPDQYSDAVVRHHKVVNARSEVGNHAILQQLQHIQNQLQPLEQLPTQMEQIIQRLDIMDARLNANSAKFANSRLDPVSGRHLPYVAVVKYVAGHPWANPPAVPNVQFAAEYVLNSPPPDNLLPLNFDELQGLVTGNLAVTRQRLMAIYWFYNDPRLAVPANGNRAACHRVIEALDYFLKYP